MPPVAVIDIGSNSIKVLVADRDDSGHVRELKSTTLDVRISAGITQNPSRLSEEGMTDGLAAIQDLLADTRIFSPTRIALVATSAVRDAVNGPDFRQQVKTATGHEIRILTGDEEANLIGRGLTSDPLLTALQDFYLFDLGGGSLECLLFHERKIVQAVSLQLGCVRLTERFVEEVALPLNVEETTAIAVHVRDELKRSGFRFPLVAPAAVFTGGSMTTVRLLRAALHGRVLHETPATVATATLATLLDEIAPLDLAQRRTIPGMPAARADVFPAALVTMLTLAEFAKINSFHHSFHNLRWGLAAETLDASS
jgi:exopolyphosphatase / guanosine-5'-triphosphate,3'-diphosphate pyrophosphatase